MRFTFLVAAVALVAPFAVASDVQEAASQMHHADGAWQPDAHGGISIRTGGEFERFTVGVEGVSELVTLTVQLGDGHEHFSDIGTLASGYSSRHLEFTTLSGGHLPGDAVHAGDLSGRGVHVVDGDGHLILAGEVPHFDAPPPVVDPPAEPISARAVMLRPDGSTLGDSRGVVVAIHGADQDSLRCEVGHLAPNTGYVVYVGEGGDAVALGDFTTNGEGGALLVRETASGAALTDHLGSLADLAGRHVEVRDHDGHVVLYGHVPGVETPHDAEPVHTEGETHDGETGADVHVVVEIHPDVGHETIRIEMHDLPHEAHHDHPAKAAHRAKAEVFLADGTGTLQRVASARIGRRGGAVVRFTTRRGGNLPLGAASLRELAGREFEVRVGGVRAVGGNLPTF